MILLKAFMGMVMLVMGCGIFAGIGGAVAWALLGTWPLAVLSGLIAGIFIYTMVWLSLIWVKVTR
jgi:hypothetical protein